MEATFSKKICMLGDFAVGKTSLTRQFVKGIFDDNYLSTIGVKVDRKVIRVSQDGNEAQLTMMVWDLAGSEKFNHTRANYLRGAAGAILVCDLTRLETLKGLQSYADDLREISPKAKLILIGNKYDLVKQRQITPQHLETAVANLNVYAYYLTSAKTGNNVDAAFQKLGELMLANDGQ